MPEAAVQNDVQQSTGEAIIHAEKIEKYYAQPSENRIQVISATDSAHQRITTTGPAGMVSRLSGGKTAPPNSPIFASWKGGTLGPALEIRRPVPNADTLTLAFPTMSNKLYTIQYADSLSQSPWSNLATITGTGSEDFLTLTNLDGQRFYRVRLNQ